MSRRGRGEGCASSRAPAATALTLIHTNNSPKRALARVSGRLTHARALLIHGISGGVHGST